MRPQILLALVAALRCVAAEPADFEMVEERAAAATTTKKTTTSTTSVKTTSTTAKTTTSVKTTSSTSSKTSSSSTSSKSTSTSTLTTSTSTTALATGPVPTTMATAFNPSQSSAVAAATSQIQQAKGTPQCAVTGGRLLSAYFQTNQSSFTVPAQCGALCESSFLCNSYAIDPSGYCRLYILPVISILQSKIPGNNTFYDRGCATSTNMCQVNGVRYLSQDKAISSSTKLQDNSFSGCQKLCKASSSCSAFSIQLGLGGACQLYSRPLYQDFLPVSSNLNIFWDIGCPQSVPGAVNAAPTLTPFVPTAPITTSLSNPNETQVVTFAAYTAPTPLTVNDPPYTATGPISTPTDDNIFEQTYTYTQYELPPVSVTGSPPVTTGINQPSGAAIPSAPCMISAGPSASFSVVNENFIPMVSRTGSIGPILQPTVAPAANDPILNPETLVLPPFYLQASSASSNVYDLIYTGSSTPQYVAMHSNGSVLLTSASTGTAFVNNLVTSIFTYDCMGVFYITQAGTTYNWVTNGAVSSFVKGTSLPNMKALPVNIPAVQAARKNRRENMIKAEKLRKRSYTDGPAPKCPASPPNLIPMVKQGYVQDTGNFCDNLDNLSEAWELSPYDFDGSCAVQSYCYDSCEDYTWVGCNAVFGTMMIASCWEEFDEWYDVVSALACTVQAGYFTGLAATSTGRDLFYKAQGNMCRCFCSSPPDTCLYSNGNFYCADLEHGRDNNNCGACGQICGPKSSCRDGGYCGCPQDQCGTTCLDFRNNPNNCGACGNVCNPAYCVGGSCYAPKPGQCTPDQGITNNDFALWEPTSVNWTEAAYPGCTLGSNINFEPTEYTGANGETTGAMLVEMTGMPSSGCQAAVTAYDAKMCPGLTYELTFVLGAVGQVGGNDVNSNAQCSIYWATGPPSAPGSNGNFQTSQSFSLNTDSETFQTFGPWGPFSVAEGDPGVTFAHGNNYVQMTAVISCTPSGGDAYFIITDVELNVVGTAKMARDTIGEADNFLLEERSANSTSFNVTQALATPYIPANNGAVVVTGAVAGNAKLKTF